MSFMSQICCVPGGELEKDEGNFFFSYHCEYLSDLPLSRGFVKFLSSDKWVYSVRCHLFQCDC